jgi:uncharacterized HhH-GPD family protein
MTGTLAVTGDAASDELLNTDPFALLVGMLLDQQVPLEWAFAAPARLRERIGERFSPGAIATMEPEELEAAFVARPALHRYPSVMAKRTYALAEALVERYDGRAAAVWDGVATGDDLLARVHALPGFGEEKAKIFVALLAKRFGVRPDGWERASAPFSDDEPRSAADVDSPDAFARVKAWKAMMRAQGKGKADAADGSDGADGADA